MYTKFAPPLVAPLPDITTEQFAVLCGVKPQSIRVSLCRHGHYFGVRPLKMPNGRLMWPGDARERMLNPTKNCMSGGGDAHNS